MTRTPVTSKAIASVGYDPTTRELEVEFRAGRVYRYLDVPGDVYQFLLRTPEKGSYLNRVIAAKFEHRDMSKPVEPEQDIVAALEASLQRKR